MGTYTAQKTIIATTSATTDVILKAGQEILLDPNFEVSSGTTLDAIIEACTLGPQGNYALHTRQKQILVTFR